MDLAALRAKIAEYMHRTDMSDALIDGFISDGMSRISLELRATWAEATEAPVAGSDGWYPLPTDYASMRVAYWFEDPALIELKPSSSIESARWVGNYGTPLGYRVVNQNVVLSPAGNSEQKLILDYFARPAFLTVADDTNYVTDYYPRLALYAALIEGSIWEDNQANTAKYNQLYADAIMQANEQADKARYGAAPVASSNYQSYGQITRSM